MAIYPPSPSETPKGLTALSGGYMFKATLAILAVILFFILYFSLVLVLGYGIYYAIFYEIEYINNWTILLKIGSVAAAVMLFLFSLKFILKLKNHKPNNRIRLDKNEHPKLVEFINQICSETGAPKPRRIYVAPDVNAYVAYSNMWLSLFLPVKKDLTIGMGLVAILNKSEFKAVVSHEFGHFAQRSMKIGSYIVSANTIIHDMIFNRDNWDRALDEWRQTDIRLSFAAWFITPIIWIIRQILRLFYVFLNIMHSLLSREMEFNADKVAVRTSGSLAIVSALWKLDYGATSWNLIIENAYLSAQKGIFVKNLYRHNQKNLEGQKPEIDQSYNKLDIDSTGNKRFFSTEANSKVSMYASHPPNHLREQSAKSPFISCEVDTSSPWEFFNEIDSLQEEMTSLIYKLYLGREVQEYAQDEVFETFIHAERKSDHLAEEYQNTFKDRFLSIPEDKELKTLIHGEKMDHRAAIDELKKELTTLMNPVKEIEGLMEKAVQILQGTSKEKSIHWKGKKYTKRHLEKVLQEMQQAREDLLNNSFIDWDKRFCQHCTALASEKNRLTDLLKLYAQHRTISMYYRILLESIKKIFMRLQSLQQQGEVTTTEISDFKNLINEKMRLLTNELETFDKMDFVPLPNIDSVTELKKAIIEDDSFPLVTNKLFENGEFDNIYNLMTATGSHCQRLEQKNLNSILELHNELV